MNAPDEPLYRTLEVDREAMTTRKDGDERIPVSLSSDTPVPRWFGLEVLDHSAAAVDLTRAANGLPLLYNHDTDQPIGRLEDVKLRRDGKLGAMMRFSRSAPAQAVLADVLDGILPDMSVGYRVNKMAEEKTPAGDTIYRATNWTPMEGSIVPVPADHTVGPNRSLEHSPPKVRYSVSEPSFDPNPLATPSQILDLAKRYHVEHRANEWMNQGHRLSDLQALIQAATIRNASEPMSAGNVDFSPREAESFSVSKAIMAIATGDWQRKGGIEREASDAIAHRMGKPARGFYLPFSLSQRASITGNIVGTSSLGGAAVQTTLMSLIEILRNRLVVRKAGARFLSGLTDTVSFPRQITANSFTWTGENPTAANTLTAATFNNLTMSPKTGMVSTAFSRQALVQSSPDMQAVVMDDIASLIAVGIDSAALNGLGSANQPTGVRNQASIGNRTLGAHGAALAWADLVGLESDVAAGNADQGRMAYITNAVTRAKLKTTLKNTVAGSLYLWEQSNDPGLINGYPAFVSNQVPSNLTQGTSTTICSSIILGDWSELLIGEWGSTVDVVVDPYTLAGQGMIAVTGFTMIDIGLRHSVAMSKSDAVLV